MSNEDSIENLKALHISNFEEEENEEEQNFVNNMTEDIDMDDEEDEDDDDAEPVTLGFVEKPKNRWSLLRHLFPSKAGGIPAWLDPINLPSGRACMCDICGEPLQFLLQVYAPISGNVKAFHRTLFVFMCPSMNCLLQDQHEQWKRGPEKVSRSVKVFRCQLPLDNPFYSSEPPKHNGTDKPLGTGAALCNWCGTWKGNKVCSSCKRARYCSEKHQALHWLSGHKVDCQQMTISAQSSQPNSSNGRTNSTEIQKVASKTLWLEHEIINEDECEFDTEEPEIDKYANLLVTTDRVGSTVNSSLDKFEGNDDMKSSASFQVSIAKAPEQVLRYCRSATAKPLWPMSSGRLSKADIPKCSYCGGLRNFEFQILPQLLYYFGVKNDVDSLDWATLAVFTCEASCETNMGYTEEYVWAQLSSHSASVRR